MPSKFWRGFVIIVVIYTGYYLFFGQGSYVELVPRKLRHIIKFIVLISVYLIGVWHLSFEKITWMKTIWHLIHLSGIFILLLFGSYDWFVHPLPSFLRFYLDDINQILIGPTVFVVMGILQQYLIKNKNNNYESI